MNEQEDSDPQPAEVPTNAEPAQDHDDARIQPEPSTGAYQPSMETATGLAIGLNPVSNVTNNYGLTRSELLSVMKEAISSEEAPELKTRYYAQRKANGKARLEYLRQNLEYEKSFIASEREVNTKISGVASKLPQTREDFVPWHKRLTPYERCFVQATAIFHGAPFSDIIKLVDHLYRPVWEREQREQEQKRRQTLTIDGQTADVIEEFQPGLPSRPSRSELLINTCTITQSVNKVIRLYWQSADRDEQYTLNLRILEFLAEETGFLVDAAFREQLALWPEQLSGECSWKAAFSLGVTLCSQNADDLWRQANQWGNSIRPRDWRLAASLLNGAYKFDCLVNPDHANNTRTSPVFRLLNQWVERAQNPANMNVRVGCAAAHTYSITGKKAPDIALTGLDRLLRFPNSALSSNWEIMPLDVLLAGVADYVGLAWSGHVRKVLEHLAGHALELALQHHLPDDLTARPRYRFQQSVNLETVFEIFFLIAASSLSEEGEIPETPYNLAEPLPISPSLPDEVGRDTLLAGILSTAEAEQIWRAHITPILCAAIFYDRDDRAYWLLHEWAKIVANPAHPNAAELQIAYIQYLLHIGKTAGGSRQRASTTGRGEAE